MKVKVKSGHQDFNKLNLGIYCRCSAAPWIFDIFIWFVNCDIFEKELRTLFFFQKSNPSTIFLTFEQTSRMFMDIEFDVCRPNNL